MSQKYSHINANSKLANMHHNANKFDLKCKEIDIGNMCAKNCAECCKDFFFVSENEFLMILEELIHRKEDIGNYHKKAKKVLEIMQKEYPSTYDTLCENMKTSNIGKNILQYFNDFDNYEKLPYCIFLNSKGQCDIYAVRPMVCRTYGTTTVCAKIKNSGVALKEEVALRENTLIKAKNGEKIMKRPYPLFYWFATFLEMPYLPMTLGKLGAIKTLNEQQYAEFTKNLT